MLDVPVAEVVLQRPCVVAIVGELEPTGMAKHVWVDRERHLGSLADALDEAVEANRADWPAALGNEHINLSKLMEWSGRAPDDRFHQCTYYPIANDFGPGSGSEGVWGEVTRTYLKIARRSRSAINVG